MIRNTLTLAAGGLAAVLGTQAPEFAQQYGQRLGGAVDELRRVVENFDRDARATGLDRAGALAHMAASADALAVRQGASASATISRFERLERQKASFDSATSGSRVLGMAGGLDWDLARRTAEDFRMAVPATFEGLAFGLAGFLAGGGVLRLLSWPFRRRPKLRLPEETGKPA
jgi:hypothetical protein